MTSSAVRVRALNIDIEIRGLAGRAREQFVELWSECQAEETSSEAVTVDLSPHDGGWAARADGQSWHIPGETSAVAAASGAVNVIATSRTRLLAVHAAVVCQGDVTVVVPGPSGAGKSTFTLAMLQQGWSYVTDEALALDWAVDEPTAYPRPITVSEATVSMLGLRRVRDPAGGETSYTPTMLGASTCRMPPQASVIVLLDRFQDGGRVTPLHRADALDALLRRGFTVHRNPGAAMTVLADLTRGCLAVEVGAADLGAAVRAVGDIAGLTRSA